MDEDPCESCRHPEKTMDDCYNQVIERLTAQGKIQDVSAHLMTLTTNHERVLYCYNILKELRFFPIVRTNSKNDLVSVYYRCYGNDCFKQKKNFEAWQFYNLSFLYATPNGENFMYAVSNRSAVFFAMEKYTECLEDIKFVLGSKFPEKLRYKLVSRREECNAKLAEIQSRGTPKDDNKTKINEILSLKGPCDDKYRMASSKLKVVFTKEMGRHVIANEDINVGEVLVQENPYLIVLLKSQFLYCCAYCLSRTMNLYPCLECTYTMYCSIICRESAYKQYHRYECKLLPSVISMEFSKMDWLSLRILFKSKTDTDDWLETFKGAAKAESRKHTDICGCVKVGERWVYHSQNYAAVHTLASNVEKRSVSDIFRKSLTAAVLTQFLTVIRFIKGEDEKYGDKLKNYATSSLLHHMMTSPTNMHGISTNIENSEGKFVDEYNIASGAYPFLSLLNHSCAPNVVRYSKLGTRKMSLIAIRPIKKGMQIFDNYGYHHAVQDRDGRQSNLKFQYKFSCMCEACVNDWPTHDKLSEAKGIPPEILQKKNECLSSEVIEKLMQGDVDTALKYYQPLCELIAALDQHAPCRELSECQEAMKQCLVIFNGVVPFEYTKEVEFKPFPPCAAILGPPHVAGYISGPTL